MLGAGGGGPKEPLKLCKRGITSIHAHDCQEGGGLRASLSKELPQEDVAFIGFAAGGWVDIKSVLSLGFVRTAVCVKPAPLTLRREKTADTIWRPGSTCPTSETSEARRKSFRGL